MKFIDYAEKLETIKYLVKFKKAGTPTQLAKKLDVSSRTVERMVQQLRDHGHPIVYNRFRGSYEIQLNEGSKNKNLPPPLFGGEAI